jgi:hypothetical protein
LRAVVNYLKLSHYPGVAKVGRRGRLRYHAASMAPRIFISYSHDRQGHMDRVWNLSERLRGDGVDCRIDQHQESPAEGIRIDAVSCSRGDLPRGSRMRTGA